MIKNERFVSRLTRRTLALILAGGRGAGLADLTQNRPDAALHFAGKFRLIDFPLSNCVNSGVRQIGVLTQYRAHPLIHHLHKAWNFLDSDRGEFIEVLPASLDNQGYAGTADAVNKNLNVIQAFDPELILILASDHVYKMDYGALLAAHIEKQADLTIGGATLPREEARRYGVLRVDEAGRIQQFWEKPPHPEPLADDPTHALVSMGIYVFNPHFLMDCLNRYQPADFARDLIPHLVAEHRLFVYLFRDMHGKQPYWRDIGDVNAYYHANMELLTPQPELDLYDKEWPLLTHQWQIPPAKFVFEEFGRTGIATDSLVSGGCILSGAQAEHSLLFSRVRLHSYAQVIDSVLLPNVSVGRHSRLRRAIVDSDVEIPPDTVIGENLDQDARRFTVTNQGVILVCRHNFN